MKKLYRSKENKILAGIFGGIGEYFDIDPVLLRVVAVFALFITGFFPMFFGYMVACMVMPKNK